MSGGVALGCFATIAAWLVARPDFTVPDFLGVLCIWRVARHPEIAALVGVAERFWNRDHLSRATLAEATFPFHVIHQTITVMIEGALLPLQLSETAEFAILLTATVAGS